MGNYIAAVSPLEAHLMARVQACDEGAFGELFSRFRERIYRTALRILKEDHSAQDALQETFLNIYRGARHFRGDSRLTTWINRITVNVCLEMIRRDKKHAGRIDGDISEKTEFPDPGARTPFEEVSRAETSRKVHHALTQLGEKHRPVVCLHDLKGHTIAEIARILQIPEGTVKSRLYYGREALKKQLEC
jgi:RNA polymerase sigma-70 factor, ECF subfamily